MDNLELLAIVLLCALVTYISSRVAVKRAFEKVDFGRVNSIVWQKIMPYKIIIVRHGESIGNVDWQVMAYTPDWALPLTQKGKEQAHDIGAKIRQYVTEKDRVRFYVSPYRRTQETYEQIVKHFDGIQTDVREEVRLREMDWGNFQDFEQMKLIKADRIKYGTFFYRVPNGEAGSDVFDRVSMFFESLFRSMQRNYPNQPTVIVIVTHGLLARFFIQRWYHFTVAEYETWANMKNCDIYLMERKPNQRFYDLVIGPRPREEDPDTKKKDAERMEIAQKATLQRRRSVLGQEEFDKIRQGRSVETRSRTPSPFRPSHALPEALQQTINSAHQLANDLAEGNLPLPSAEDQREINQLVES